MPENASNMEPLPGPVTATIQKEICLHSLYFYGTPTVAAQSLGCLVKPLNHGPGRPHSISVHILGSLAGYRIEILKQWAAAGDCFIKLVWTFPGGDHPEFVTRHLLVIDTAPGHVSFSGGIGWAEDLWKAAQSLQQRPACPLLGPQISVPRWNPAAWPPHGDAKPLPLSQPVPLIKLAQPMPLMKLAQPVPCLDSPHWKLRSQAALADPRYGPHNTVQEDTVSEPSSEPTLATDTDSDSSVVFSEPAEMAAAEENFVSRGESYPTGPEDGNSSSSRVQQQQQQQKQQQQIDRLRRKKREADALFARNGDPSGLLAVLAEASLSNDNWDASGMPRF